MFIYHRQALVLQRAPHHLQRVLPAEVEQAGVEIMELVERYCGGRARFALLSRHQPSISLAV